MRLVFLADLLANVLTNKTK